MIIFLIFLPVYLFILVPILHADWGSVTVDSKGDTGWNPSLALDKSGMPCIVYNDWENGSLKYASFDGNSWHAITIDNSGFVGGTPSLALDSDDNPHVSYFDFTEEDLLYIYRDAGGWHKETIASEGSPGLYSSIEIDSGGRPHVAYEDLTNMDLKYAVRISPGVWDLETVDSDTDVGQYASLELDSSDKPHIAYLDWINADLKYAKKTGSTWQISVIDSEGFTGYYSSLRLDSNNKPHIAYQNSTQQDLRYATNQSGTWQKGIVDADGDVGEFTSLALDSANKPAIAYYSVKEEKLKYAKWSGSSWIKEVVSVSDFESWHVCLAIDSGNKAHIAYLDWIAGDLKYARTTNAPVLSWVGEEPFLNDGLDPEEGNTYTSYVFRVTYEDPDSDPVLGGYPKVHISKDDEEIEGSPFAMSFLSEDVPGKTVFEANAFVPEDGTYSYYFEAKDRWGSPATGEPTSATQGPTVTAIEKPPFEVYSYPNPARGDKATFHVKTWYLSPKFKIKIFNIAGELVKEIEDTSIPKHNAPVYEYEWDLKDANGFPLSSGVYLYMVRSMDKITGDKMKKVKKMAILK
ncbi:hypothetical protein ACFL6Y_02720 [Elusimicrobiota bacterium]